MSWFQHQNISAALEVHHTFRVETLKIFLTAMRQATLFVFAFSALGPTILTGLDRTPYSLAVAASTCFRLIIFCFATAIYFFITNQQ